MKERRKIERFPLSLLARIETDDSSRKQIFEFKTRDISSAGAFIDTTEKFPEGTRFKLDFTIPSKRIKEITGALSLIECEGNVIRSTEHGMAVRFNSDCLVTGVKSV